MMRRTLLALAAAGALGTVGLLLVGFVWPDVDPRVNLGRVEAFAPGTVTSFYIREIGGEIQPLKPGESVGGCGAVYSRSYRRLSGEVIHLAHLEDGSLIALSGRSTRLGGMVPWLPDFSYEGEFGWFREVCGSTWAMDGTRVFGPAPRDLDRFHLEIRDGRVVVDLTRVTPGEWGAGSVRRGR